MEQIVLVLMLFVTVNCAVKLSFWKWWQAVAYGLVCAAFTVLALPEAVGQSKTQLAAYLQDTAALQDMAIAVTVESAVSFAFCVSYLRRAAGRRRAWWEAALWWYPGLLMLPVLFYCLTELVFSLTGVPFALTAWVMAAAVLVALPLLARAMAWLLPEPALRIETHFLVSLLVCILGLLSTENGRTVYAPAAEPVDWRAVAVAASLAAALAAVGFAWAAAKFPLAQRRREKKRQRQTKP